MQSSSATPGVTIALAEQSADEVPGQVAAFDGLHAREAVIDKHHAAVVEFLEKVLQPQQSPDVCRTAVELVEAADYLEAIGDLLDRDVIPRYLRHVENGTELNPQARGRLRQLAVAIGEELGRALRAVAESDPDLARSVLDAKSQVRRLERAAIDLPMNALAGETLAGGLPNALERELTESLRRAYSLIRRFVRVGTGLLRADMGNIAEQDGG